MKPDFVALMAKNDQTYYPLRFMSSEFFLTYWKTFIPMDWEQKETDSIQNAARQSVDYAMYGETIYWLISFDEATALKSWQLFQSRLSGLSDDIWKAIQALCRQIASPKEEQYNANHVIELMTRLRFDSTYRNAFAYPAQDALLLDAAYEYDSQDWTDDLLSIKEGFLASQEPWDQKLRSQTPDLPESIWLIFSEAYNARTNLLTIQRNLKLLLKNQADYQLFISRLHTIFEKTAPQNAGIQFPTLLL